jgi:hypothetical protein
MSKIQGIPSAYAASTTAPTGNALKPIGNITKVAVSKKTGNEVVVDNRTLSAQRLNPNKCADPFASNAKKCKTTFSQSYISGSIPCRLQSTASRYFLQWDAPAATGFSPDLLVVCADGLAETEHPHVVLAPMMFHELILRSEGCVEMFAPVIEPIGAHIRKALMAQESFDLALSSLSLLLQHTGNLLTPQLHKLVPCLARAFNDKKRRDAVLQCLGLMEQQCGLEATKLIKSKIPVY